MTTIDGIRVLDWQDPDIREYAKRAGHLPDGFDLDYDAMFISSSMYCILVGEMNHFQYRIRAIADNEAARKQASEHIKQAAEKILGEPWKLSSP